MEIGLIVSGVSAFAALMSAGSAIATFYWARESVKISKQLKSIEEQRDRRDLALLRVYQDPEIEDKGIICSLINDGKGVTRILRAYIQVNPNERLPLGDYHPGLGLDIVDVRPFEKPLHSHDIVHLGTNALDALRPHLIAEPVVIVYATHDDNPIELRLDPSRLPFERLRTTTNNL